MRRQISSPRQTLNHETPMTPNQSPAPEGTPRNPTLAEFAGDDGSAPPLAHVLRVAPVTEADVAWAKSQIPPAAPPSEPLPTEGEMEVCKKIYFPWDRGDVLAAVFQLRAHCAAQVQEAMAAEKLATEKLRWIILRADLKLTEAGVPMRAREDSLDTDWELDARISVLIEDRRALQQQLREMADSYRISASSLQSQLVKTQQQLKERETLMAEMVRDGAEAETERTELRQALLASEALVKQMREALQMADRRLADLLSEETGPCPATQAVRAALSAPDSTKEEQTPPLALAPRPQRDSVPPDARP
jgi:hypothetical protein